MHHEPNTVLQGKTVIGTAGNQGGGAVVALRFGTSSANVVIIADKSQHQHTMPVTTVADKIIAASGRALTLEVNLADAHDIQ